MNSDRTYIFLYWTPHHRIFQSGLIDIDSAINLWNEYLYDFGERHKLNEKIIMTIYMGCQHENDFDDWLYYMDTEYPVAPKISQIISEICCVCVRGWKIYNILCLNEFRDNNMYDKIIELQKTDRVTALSYMFNELENRMLDANYVFVDEFMRRIHIEKYCVSVLIGILTITLPFESQLAYRSYFLERVRKYVYDTHSKEEADKIFRYIQ